MKKSDKKKGVLVSDINELAKLKKKKSSLELATEKYFTFFNHAPISLWIEDFSKVKQYAAKLAKEHNTTIKSFLQNNPTIIPELALLVSIKDVNNTALKLYNAKSKEELLSNLNKIFTEKSKEGFAKLIVNVLIGEKKTEIETINKKINGEEFDVLIKFEVIEGSEETLENVVVSVENITDRVKNRKALAESEKRYKESQEIAKIGSWFYCFDTKNLHWSEETYKMLGIEHKNQNLNLEYYLSFIHNDDKKIVEDFTYSSLLKNPNQNLKYRIYTKQGELKYIHEKRSSIIAHGKVVRIVGICQDITERILSEKKLSEAKNILSNTLTNIQDGLVILDHNSNYTYINKKAEDFLGKNSKDLLGKHIWTEFPEKEGDLFFDNYQKALETKKPISFENYFAPWNRWFENRIIPSNDGMLLFFHEITKRKLAENKIKTAYNIINKSPTVAILCENKRNFPVVFASENAENLFGYSYSEFLQNKIEIQKVVYPDDLEYIRTEIFKLAKSKNTTSIKPKPFRVFTKKGKVKWVASNIDAIKDANNTITHIQGIVEDITERKNTEDLFLKNTQRLENQFNNTPLASIIFDLDFKILEWNNSAERIFGYTAEEVKGKDGKDLLTPPHLLSEMKILRKTMFTQTESLKNTNENITKNGNIITCDWYTVILRDTQNTIIGRACLIDDKTESINSKKLLEKSEKKYRSIFEKSIDAVLVIKNDEIVDCNNAAVKVYGYKNRQELLNESPFNLTPEILPDGSSSFLKAQKMMGIALEEGSIRFTCHHQRKGKQIFPSEITFTRLEEQGNNSAIHMVVRDITEKIKQDALEDVLYNISKTALTISDFKKFSLFVRNELHKIIDTSNFYIALYNEETDMITTPVFVDDREEVEEFSAKKSLTGQVIKTKKSLILTKKDHLNLINKGVVDLIGSAAEKWVGVPLLIQNKCIGAIVVQSYDNEYAYTENDVQLLEFVADQISTTILRKNAENDLKNALAKAKESDRLKSSFLANMSHEIRTPMNGIIGFSEFFLDQNLTPENRNKYAKIIINSSKQLLSIVNDILDISKIEAGEIKLNYESVHINKLLNELYEFYTPKAQENNLLLNCAKGLENNQSVIEIDKLKLYQVLNNLLSNAFKFTDEGSIEFGYKLEENKLLFYVKDTGVGIEEKLQDQIFDRFIQANIDLVKKHKGTGLGLAISKKFIELFNGEIWLDSTNKGSTIYFTIPYLKSKTKLITSYIEEQKPKIQVEKQELTILVAEDEIYNMMYINELFSKSNFKIIEAENGEEAVKLSLSNSEIDLVLMDIKMPIMDGNEAMIKIKKVKPLLPIIALSAFAMESDKKAALNNGFDAYLTKPIDKKLLFSIIGKYAKNYN
tara:strand:- start:44375 stop:48454 length:4080 start_codon:yes stop_codon:yes gene_type:complete